MNFVTVENLATATATLDAAAAAWELTLLSAARSQPILDMHRPPRRTRQCGSSPPARRLPDERHPTHSRFGCLIGVVRWVRATPN